MLRHNVFCAVRGFLTIVLLFSSTISLAHVEAQTRKHRSKQTAQAKKQNQSAEDIEFAKLLDIMTADIEAGWDTVVHSSTSILKYNPKRVTFLPSGVVRIWIKEYLKRPFLENRRIMIAEQERLGVKPKGYESLAYKFMLFETDCASAFRIISSSAHDINGNLLDSTSSPSGWHDITPDSIGEAIMAKACSLTNSKPDWKLGAFSEEMNCFYDRNSITRSQNGNVVMLEKWSLRPDTTAGRKQRLAAVELLGKTVGNERASFYSYDVIRNEYNCTEGTLRQIKWLVYDQNDRLLTELAVPTDWSPPQSDGIAERMMRVACNQK